MDRRAQECVTGWCGHRSGHPIVRAQTATTARAVKRYALAYGVKVSWGRMGLILPLSGTARQDEAAQREAGQC